MTGQNSQPCPAAHHKEKIPSVRVVHIAKMHGAACDRVTLCLAYKRMQSSGEGNVKPPFIHGDVVTARLLEGTYHPVHGCIQ